MQPEGLLSFHKSPSFMPVIDGDTFQHHTFNIPLYPLGSSFNKFPHQSYTYFMPNASNSSSFDGVNAIKLLIMQFSPISSIIHYGPKHHPQHLVLLENFHPYVTCPIQFQSLLTWFNLPNCMLTLQKQSDIEESYLQPFRTGKSLTISALL